MLKRAILNNWKTDISGYAQKIDLNDLKEYPAWTIKLEDSYGVAIPYAGDEKINESFANAKIRSTNIKIDDGNEIQTIILITDTISIQEHFAALCSELIEPGINGNKRKQIISSPVTWWKEWKELLGNKNIDERIYDVLGELCVLKYLVEHGEEAEWNGPLHASYDIETEAKFYEVKSSINRVKKEVTISSQFQLAPSGKSLELVLCRFEPTVLTGVSIDGLLNEFKALGYNIDILNNKLESCGFEIGMSARKRTFILHEMLLYKVDDSFPRITPESFIGRVLPEGITKISYTVDLSGLSSVSLIKGEDNDIQNN